MFGGLNVSHKAGGILVTVTNEDKIDGAYLIDTSGKGELKPVFKHISVNSASIGPNSEIFIREVFNLQMIHPVKMDFGSCRQYSTGGNSNRLVI